MTRLDRRLFILDLRLAVLVASDGERDMVAVVAKCFVAEEARWNKQLEGPGSYWLIPVVANGNCEVLGCLKQSKKVQSEGQEYNDVMENKICQHNEREEWKKNEKTRC